MDDLSPEAVRLLQASLIAEPPSAAARTRIRAGLAVATGSALIAGGSGTATAAAAAGSTKVMIAAVIAGVIGFGSGALVVHALDARREAEPAPAQTRMAAQLAPAPEPPPRAADSAAPHAPSPSPSRAIAPARKPAEHAEPAEPAAPPPVEPTRAAGTGLGAELELIRAADDALAMHRPGRALVLVEDHATQFPDGQLAQERDSLRVLALCGLDRVDDAHAAAQAFFTRWPGSPHADRVTASCAGGDK